MPVPEINHPVRGSSTGRPIMVVLDLLGRKTTLRIFWELRGGPLTFRALQDACETNPRLLNIRLGELRSAGLIDHESGGYRLTSDGEELREAMGPLLDWAAQWAQARAGDRRDATAEPKLGTTGPAGSTTGAAGSNEK